MTLRRIGRALWLAIFVGLALVAAVHLAVTYWTFNWPNTDQPEAADAIICLGGDQRGDASLGPGSTLRVEACATLYRAGVAPVVVYTGSGRPERSTAQAMAELGVDLGVPASAVLIEETAQSTLQNAAFTLPLLPEDASIIIVTDTYHLPRSWASFRVMGARDITLFPAANPVTGPGSGYGETGPPGRYLRRETKAIGFNAVRIVIFGLGTLLGVPQDTRTDWLR